MSRSDLARETYWKASAEAKVVIARQAQLQLQSRLATLGVLEQRLTQTTGFLLAATGFAATLAAGELPARGLAALSAVIFAVGAFVCFWGMMSVRSPLPGQHPAWWAAAGDALEHFTKDDAEYYAIGGEQDVLDGLERIIERRADAIDLGLRFALAAGFLIALAASFSVFS